MRTDGSNDTFRWFLRGCALVLALGLAVYIVRDQHRSAQPPEPAAEQTPAAVPASLVPVSPTTTPREPEPASAREPAGSEPTPTFFHTSKAYAPAPEPEPRTFFHSSKSMAPPQQAPDAEP